MQKVSHLVKSDSNLRLHAPLYAESICMETLIRPYARIKKLTWTLKLMTFTGMRCITDCFTVPVIVDPLGLYVCTYVQCTYSTFPASLVRPVQGVATITPQKEDRGRVPVLLCTYKRFIPYC